MIIKETSAMISGMSPVLAEGAYVFCTTSDLARMAELLPAALSMHREDEGLSCIMPTALAFEHGFDVSLPMRMITLKVQSALDGVGLTAAVSSALARRDIPCNIVAAFHHDYVFVPVNLAEVALQLLQDLSNANSAGAEVASTAQS